MGGEAGLIGGLVRRQRRGEVFGLRQKQERRGELLQGPAALHGLAAKPVKAVLVEIGGGEVRVRLGQEAPGAEIEGLAGDVEIVGIHHAVHEAGGHPLADHPAGRRRNLLQQGAGLAGHVRVVGPRMELRNAVVHQLRHRFAVIQVRAALESAEPDMAVRQAHEYRGAGGGGLVIALQRLARLEQAERLGGVHAKGFEIARGQDFAHPALQRQAAIAAP